MKARLSVLLTVASLLAIWLVVDWRHSHRKPSYTDFDFLPIVRDLKPEASGGDFVHGRWDIFLIHKPRTELYRDLLHDHIGQLNRIGPYKIPLITPDPPGYSAVSVQIYPLVKHGVSSKDWSHVNVFRRTSPITNEEIAEARRTDMVSNRLDQIRWSIRSRHSLSANDKQFLVRTVADSYLISSSMAALSLVMAEDEKLLPRQVALDVIGAKVERAEPDLVGIYTSTYAMALHLPTRPTDDVETEHVAVRRKRKYARLLDLEERRLVGRALKGSKGQNDSMVAGIFTQKRGLDLNSFAWMNKVIEAQIRTTTSDRKLLWEFVQRVVNVRNGVAHNA